MYFPFLTREVKCGDQALNVADRQNMHSASILVKRIVELFRRIKREDELHRKVLAFSVSHDNETVKIYGHYALINGTKTRFIAMQYESSILRNRTVKINGRPTNSRGMSTTYMFQSISKESVPLLTSCPIQKSSVWSPLAAVKHRPRGAR